jgi:hypothetical protein
MKVVCSEVIGFVDKVADGIARPDVELEFMHAAGVKTGRDCLVDGQLLARTTSLHMLLSTQGMRVAAAYDAAERAAADRYAKIFLRERREVEATEIKQRDEVEAEWQHGFWTIVQDPRADPSDIDSARTRASSRVTTGVKRPGKTTKGRPTKSAEARKQGAAFQKADVDEVSVFDLYITPPLSLDAFGRLFLFAAQCMQYHRLKMSAIHLCLEFNGKTKGRYAGQVLPYVMSLQHATNQNYAETLAAFDETSRDEVRALKLTAAAQKAWALYQQTDAFRLVLNRTSATLMPAKRAAMGLGTLPTSDNISVGSGTTIGAGGPSAYKDLAQQYQTAITTLRQKQALETLVPLECELGKIHLLHRNRTEAERAWCDAVDATVGRVNMVTTWRSALDALGPQATVKCGYWKLLHACNALCQLAMHVYGNDQRNAVDCCLLASVLLWRAVSSSLTGPQRLWDAAALTLNQLMPGLTFDVDSPHLPDLGHGLLYAARHLERHGFYAQAATVAAVLELLALHALRSVDLTVQARCVRARAAAGMGRFEAALVQLGMVLRGRALPDAALGQFDGATYDVAADVGQRGGTAPGGTRGAGATAGGKGKGAPSDKAAKGAAVDAGGEEGNSLPLYNDAKSANFDGNVKALEAVTALLVNGTALNEVVAATYGQMTTRAALTTYATVFARLAATDDSAALAAAPAIDDAASAAANAAPTQAAKGGKAPAGKAAAASAAAAGDVPTGNTHAAALLAAEKVVSAAMSAVITSRRPKSAGAVAHPQRGSTPPVGGNHPGTAAPHKTPSSATPAEDHAFAVELCLLSAWIRLTCGAYVAAEERCNEGIALHDACSNDALLQVTKDVPSYLYAVDEFLIASLHLTAAEALLRLGRAEASMFAARHAIDLAKATNDQFVTRVALVALAKAQARAGLVDDALLRSTEAIVTAAALEYKGIDDFWASAVAGTAVELHNLVRNPLLGTSQSELEQLFAPNDTAAADGARAKLPKGEVHEPSQVVTLVHDALDSISLNAQHHGANPALTPMDRPSDELRLENCAVANPASLRLLAAAIVSARTLMPKGSVAAAQLHLRRALTVAPQSQSATALPHLTAWAELLLATALRVEHDGNVTVAKVATSDRVAAATDILRGVQPTTEGHEVEPPQHLVARLALITSAAGSTVATGTHDFELIRQAALEAFAAHAAVASPQHHLRAFAALSIGCQAAKRHRDLFANAGNVLATDIPLSDCGGADLPAAVVAAIDDVARRQSQAQGAFASSNAATAAAANNGSVPASLAAANAPPKAMLSHAVQLFAQLHGELATASPVDARPVEAALQALRGLLQTHAPQLMFAAPLVLTQPAPVASFKSYTVACQTFVPDATKLPEAALAPGNQVAAKLPPHAVLALCVWPNGDRGQSDAEKAAADGGAKGGSAKKPAGKAVAAAAADAGASETKVSVPPNPLIVAALPIAQRTLVKVHRDAKDVYRTMVDLQGGLASLETVLGEATAAAAKADKGAASKSGKEGKSGATPTPDDHASGQDSDGLLRTRAAERTRAMDEKKGALLMAFVEGLVSAKMPAGFTAKDVRPLYPSFPLTAAHVASLAALTDPYGGAMVHGDAELCQWFAQIANALDSIDRRLKRAAQQAAH